MDNALETSASIADTHSEVCEAVEALLDLMKRNPLQREIYLQVIEFCETRRALAEAEAMVASCPGFSLTAQTPFRLIANVVDNGGIHWYEVDAAGSVITEERKAGLTDDEADDLVEGFALETSDAGRKACELMGPERRASRFSPSRVPISWRCTSASARPASAICSIRRPSVSARIWTSSTSAASRSPSRLSRRLCAILARSLYPPRRVVRCSRVTSWTCWSAAAAWCGIRDGRRQERGVRWRSRYGLPWPFRTTS